MSQFLQLQHVLHSAISLSGSCHDVIQVQTCGSLAADAETIPEHFNIERTTCFLADTFGRNAHAQLNNELIHISHACIPRIRCNYSQAVMDRVDFFLRDWLMIRRMLVHEIRYAHA
jgi:hypothetical protein